MVLDKKDKKILDTMIEEEISKIPGLVRNLRLPQFQEGFQIKNESEYIYGYTHGSIIGKFETYYFVVHSGKKPGGPEVDEIGKTIFEKSNEIRDAISKSSSKE
ncbi:hypothetical protein HW44_17680 [Nitrosococcus oceani]|nr:hypothetical protein HW44_17680 [Nitrosococcus oceani]